MSRTCKSCGELKPLSAFRLCVKRRPGRADSRWYKTSCKPCENREIKTRQKKNGTRARHRRRQHWMTGRGGHRTPGWYATMLRMGRAYGQALANKRRKRRARISADRWIEYLRQHRPDLYDPSLSRRALAFRGRYHADPAFRQYHVDKARSREWDRDGRSDGSLTVSVIRQLFAAATMCPYCKQSMRSQDKSLDHVVPLARGGRHSITNVTVCHLRCNMHKSDKRLADNEIDGVAA